MPRICGRIDANARAAGLAIGADRPRRRPEILRRILGVNPPFDGESIDPDIVLKETERFAGGNPNLLADQIHSRHHFGDGVLDLNARVHFKEEEARIGDETLDRADRIVADRLRRSHGRGAHFPAQVGGEPCRCFLPEFLVAALERTIALSDVEYGAVLVGENLQFDVLRIIQVALGVDRRVLEVCFRFAARRFERRFKLGVVVRDLQSLAAAAARSLKRERVAVTSCRAARVFEIFDRREAAGNDRHVGFLHRGPRTQLVPHRIDRVGVRPDPRQPGFDHASRERRVLGEEAVPGVNRLGAGAPRDLDEFVDVKVTERRRSRPDQVGFVGHAHVERVAIGFGVDRNGCNVHLACGSNDTDRDLAAVGD